jgi:predicted RNA binding protein YcfA (HicA-like mRNA interferase family)
MCIDKKIGRVWRKCVSLDLSNEGLVVDSRDLIKELQKHGWYEVKQVGSHKQFKHATKKGRVSVPHPKRDIPIGTLKSIERQCGIKLR